MLGLETTCDSLEATDGAYFSYVKTMVGAVVAQMVSARLSEREIPGSILGDFNVCFDFPLICVAIALYP